MFTEVTVEKNIDNIVAKKMVKFIRTAFHKIIQNAHWMDNSTKFMARKKLDAMKQMVGYPDQLVNQTLVDGISKGKV